MTDTPTPQPNERKQLARRIAELEAAIAMEQRRMLELMSKAPTGPMPH
ncbi:hypothetical protein [Sinorhizobium fredii]|nr:hypothetical protein [Sinorhizobium fredii]